MFVELLCALGVHMVSLLYSTVQLLHTSLASVEVLFTNFKIGYKQTNKQKTDSGVYRLAPARKNYVDTAVNNISSIIM